MKQQSRGWGGTQVVGSVGLGLSQFSSGGALPLGNRAVSLLLAPLVASLPPPAVLCPALGPEQPASVWGLQPCSVWLCRQELGVPGVPRHSDGAPPSGPPHEVEQKDSRTPQPRAASLCIHAPLAQSHCACHRPLASSHHLFVFKDAFTRPSL